MDPYKKLPTQILEQLTGLINLCENLMEAGHDRHVDYACTVVDGCSLALDMWFANKTLADDEALATRLSKMRLSHLRKRFCEAVVDDALLSGTPDNDVDSGGEEDCGNRRGDA